MGLGQADKEGVSYSPRTEGGTGFERQIGAISSPPYPHGPFPFNSSNSPPLKCITLMLKGSWAWGQIETQSTQDGHHGDSENMILRRDSSQERKRSLS